MPSSPRRTSVLRIATAAALFACRALAQGSPSTSSFQFTPLFNVATAPVLRAEATWRARPGIRFSAELDQSRQLTIGEAWFQIGDAEGSGWSTRIGRQRLSFGDERLIGANREPGLSPPGWDCAHLQASRGRVAAEIISGVSRYYGARLDGAVTTISLLNGIVEPYWLRKTAGSAAVSAAGFRAAGTLRSAAYNVEMVSEGSAWAGHWELSRATGKTEAGAEWNYASPGFDEFFPARLNQFNTEDPYGWTDTANTAFNFKRALRGSIGIAASYRTYWSASGAYQTGHAVAGFRWERPHLTLTAGCGRLVRSEDATVQVWTPHLALAYKF